LFLFLLLYSAYERRAKHLIEVFIRQDYLTKKKGQTTATGFILLCKTSQNNQLLIIHWYSLVFIISALAKMMSAQFGLFYCVIISQIKHNFTILFITKSLITNFKYYLLKG